MKMMLGFVAGAWAGNAAPVRPARDSRLRIIKGSITGWPPFSLPRHDLRMGRACSPRGRSLAGPRPYWRGAASGEGFLLAVGRDERMAYPRPVFVGPVARKPAELVLEVAD